MSLDLNIDIDKEEFKRSRSMFTDEKEQALKRLEKEELSLSKRVTKDNYLLDKDLINIKEDPIPYFDENKDKLYAPFNKTQEEPQGENLVDLLDGFFKRELLNNVENYYTCYNCNKKLGEPKKGEVRFITKTFFLYHPSPVIAITLKRFKKSTSNFWGSSGGFSKIDTSVKFPLRLSLDKYFLSKLQSNNQK